MKIYLVTHAHTEQSPGVPAEGWGLSRRGLEQAAELANAPFWPEVDRIVLSSEAKTWLTIAEIATSRKLPVWVDCRFDEVRRSGWVDDYAGQVNRLFAKPYESIEGWERASDAQKRALEGLVGVQNRFPGESVVLVGHGLCFSLLRSKLLGQPNVDYNSWQRLAFASYACFAGQPLNLVSDFVLNESGVR